MSRLSVALQALRSLARTPSLLNHVIAGDVADWQRRALAHAGRQLTAKGLPMVSLAHFLSPADTTVRPFAFREGGSLPTDLLLLRALARRVPGCRYLEIGTWRGESAANVAAVAAEVFTLNLSAEEIRALPQRLSTPQLMNMVIGGKTPITDAGELADLGYGRVLYANAALQGAVAGMQKALGQLRNERRVDENPAVVAPFAERQRLVNKPFWDALEKKYE